jgi:hypothetical protein
MELSLIFVLSLKPKAYEGWVIKSLRESVLQPTLYFFYVDNYVDNFIYNFI